MFVDPRNGPAWDLQPSGADPRVYVVASTPRSGSTLLCRWLWATGRVGAPKEYLNPMQVRDWTVRAGGVRGWLHRPLVGPAVGVAGRGAWDDPRVREHLAAVRARRTGSTGWFGLKLHWHHAARWFVDPGRDLDAFLPVDRWVRMRRDDRLAQAVSWTRALQTGRWAAHQRAWAPARYDRAAITARLADLETAEAGWDALLAGRRVLDVRHEALVADPEATIRRVLAFLDVPHADRVTIPAAPLRPQADATNAAWIARHREGA